MTDAAPSAPQPDPETMKKAMKAFRKRLKLTKLDEESKLSPRAMTGGKHSQVVAIMPPRDFPPSVWEALVAQGKLKKARSGFYELAEGAN